MPIDAVAVPVLLIAFGLAVFGLSRFTRDSRPQVRASLSGLGLGDSARAVLTFTWLILGTAFVVGIVGMAMGLR